MAHAAVQTVALRALEHEVVLRIRQRVPTRGRTGPVPVARIERALSRERRESVLRAAVERAV